MIPFLEKRFHDEDELRREGFPYPPVRFALVCHPDQLIAEGYGREDIYRLFAWDDGKVQIADAEEQLRLNRLRLLVVRCA